MVIVTCLLFSLVGGVLFGLGLRMWDEWREKQIAKNTQAAVEATKIEPIKEEVKAPVRTLDKSMN